MVYKTLEKIHIDLIGYVIFSILLFINYFSPNVLKYIGILISIFGFGIWIAGLISLKDAFQIRAEAKKLVTSGIYSKIRHPIYYGSALIDLGLFIYSIGTIWVVLPVILIVIDIVVQVPRIIKEEKLLSKKFKDKYKRYGDQTWI